MFTLCALGVGSAKDYRLHEATYAMPLRRYLGRENTAVGTQERVEGIKKNKAQRRNGTSKGVSVENLETNKDKQ